MTVAGAADVLSVSVHGPAGVVDLHVPAGASGGDVAGEYARTSGYGEPFDLATSVGRPVAPTTTLADAGLRSGAVLVVVPQHAGLGTRRRGMAGAGHALRRGRLSVLWLSVAATAAVVAGGLAASLPDSSTERTTVLVALLAAAALGAIPLGPLAAQRVHAAPAFAAAAAFGLVWHPAPERLPLVLGVTGLVGAATAAVCRGLDQQQDEGLRVWLFVGAATFGVTALAAVVAAPTPLVWCLFLVVAMLAARFVPALAVDVPDQYLLDLERLAVTAWSARDRPAGRRGRTIVPRRAVAGVASSGTRLTTAACLAILGVAAVAAPLLLRDADLEIDRWGARGVVFFAGGALLLTARSFRNTTARALLRLAGLASWIPVAVVMLRLAGPDARTAVAAAAIGLAGLLVVVGVALGRGWRSAWWSRRAEVAEGLCGAFAIAGVVVASGLFRILWESIG
jgi:hypothetical protein